MNQQVQILNTLDESLTSFQALVARTPRDQFGFLTYLINHTSLPIDILERPKEKQKQLIDTAKISLSMQEGYLAHNFSQPIWNKLPHEPDSYYDIFRIYLNLPERLHQIDWESHAQQEAEKNNDTYNNYDVPTKADLGIRPLHIIEKQYPQLNNDQLKEMYILYYWKDRAHAYDLGKKVAAAQLVEQRVIQTEDQDYHFSSKMLSYLGHEVQSRIDDDLQQGGTGRPFQDLHMKDVMAIAGQMVEIRRVSLNLPGRGPATKTEPYLNRGTTTEGKLQDAVKVENQNNNEQDSNITQKQLEQAIANDPEKAAKLQELAMELLSPSSDA